MVFADGLVRVSTKPIARIRGKTAVTLYWLYSLHKAVQGCVANSRSPRVYMLFALRNIRRILKLQVR